MLISYLVLCRFLFVVFVIVMSRVIGPNSCIKYYMIPQILLITIRRNAVFCAVHV